MKILHIGKYYPPFRGGMETALQNVSEGLLDAGHEVTVITAGETTLEQTETIAGPVSGRQGRLIRLGVNGVLFSQPVTADLIGAMRREVTHMNPDIVHVHLPNPLAAAAWEVLCGLLRQPRPVLTVWYHADITRQKLGRHLVKPLLDLCLKRAAGICVAAKALRINSPVLQPFREKVSVVPFGIEEEPWLSVEPRRDGPFLFVGRLVPYKGVAVLLNAMAQDTISELVIVGDGPLKSSLVGRVHELGLNSRVTFAGTLDKEKIAAHLARAMALVLPSVDESEAFGLVQLEAMAAGVPVIATDLPTGVPEVGVAGETGFLVPPNDEDSLAKVLQEIQGDEGLRREMGEAGRRRFIARYSRVRMVDGLVDFYQNSLNRNQEKASAS
ncbi:MAG: glycosyltransferase involved in cell wall biosynthesis [Candidatus Krumholzibacteriia bacterium]|jgi:glycosyltransferase involved in cell wall biosynthesis